MLPKKSYSCITGTDRLRLLSTFFFHLSLSFSTLSHHTFNSLPACDVMFCLLHVIVFAIAFAAPLCFSKLRCLKQPAHASSCLCLVMEAALFKTSLICPCLLSPPKAHYLDKVVKGMALLLSYLFYHFSTNPSFKKLIFRVALVFSISPCFHASPTRSLSNHAAVVPPHPIRCFATAPLSTFTPAEWAAREPERLLSCCIPAVELRGMDGPQDPRREGWRRVTDLANRRHA